MNTRSGYTLIEIIVASAMALIVLLALMSVVSFGQGVEREARSSYLIRQEADVVFRQIQEELRMTHLASIRLGDGDNGIAMASPISDNAMTSFELTRFGIAKWKNWVHFATVARDDNVGTLVRWETSFPAHTNLPLPPSKTDTTPTDPKWTLLSNVLLPGRGPVNGSGGDKVLGAQEGGGGLQLRFLRRENEGESLSKLNPAQKSDSEDTGWSRGSTQIVDCTLKVADISSESGKLSLHSLNFRVKPRN